MYLTFEEAFNRIFNIKDKKYKHVLYPQTRVHQLIRDGFLEGVYPELFYVDNSGNYQKVNKDKPLHMVTAESVERYVNSKLKMIKKHGYTYVYSKRVLATFYDGETMEFDTMGIAVKTFKLTYRKLKTAIESCNPIEVKVLPKRAEFVLMDTNDETVITETVKFSYL